MGRAPLKEQDFIHPYGQLMPQQFEGVTDCLEDDIQKWLWLASTKTASITHDESRRCAIEDYVYWKAFFVLWAYWNAQPVEVSLKDEKTTRFTTQQIQAWRSLWEQHQENFQAALASVTTAYTDDFRSRVVSASSSWNPVLSTRGATEPERRAAGS